MHWFALVAAVTTSVLGQALLKGGAGAPSFLDQLRDWRTIGGLGVYGMSAVLYIVALRRIPLSVALPCTAGSYLVVALIGHFAFDEPLGAMRLGALGLIGLGVLLLATA